ncbi:MAG: hypothetical protein CVU39_19320 [Chloroflexi bacterium HGW-Chloroflexi-10]|nr:MAG: hypothetical protein CVU39_19320 [Chloroflexi bacterium HGW-Chloroflexi-10]
MKIAIRDRILLLLTGLLAAYQIAVGIDGFSTLPMIAYSTAFGVLLLAGLLLLILGFEVLDSPIVVMVSTIIPLCLATGLVWQHLSYYRIAYLVFAIVGLLATVITRTLPIKNRLPLFVLVIVHGIAGLTIFLLPIILVFSGLAPSGFFLISVGGALIGLGGLLLALLKAGRPLLSRETIFRVLPAQLLLMTAAFVTGFALG